MIDPQTAAKWLEVKAPFIRKFSEEMLIDLKIQLQGRGAYPDKLYYLQSNFELKLWAVTDDDWTKDVLVKAQSMVNLYYEDSGFRITSTIVDKRSELNVPNGFQQV